MRQDRHKLAVTVDVEDWYHVPAVSGSPFALYRNVPEFFRSWQSRYDFLSEPTHNVLSMLGDRGVQATFFVVGDVVERYPGLVRMISRAGHEIACHGFHHACAIDPRTRSPLMAEAEFIADVRAARSALEDATGQRVVGYRAPAAYIAGWMLDCLEELGFTYDSSVCRNSLYNKSDSSLRGVGTAPYWPARGDLVPGERRSLLEIPWPAIHVGFRLPTGGGPLLRLLGRHYIACGLRDSLRRGDSVFYFHPIDISSEKFPIEQSAKRPLYWAIKGEVVRRRIEWLLDRFADSTTCCRELVARMSQKG